MPERDEFSFLPAQAADLGRELPPVERVRLTLADGRTLSGLRWGAAPPALTLLHGAGLNAHTWDTTLLHLGVPALALDLPGHGDSSWRDDAAYVARVLAPDVITALEQWTTGPQVLVGHSLGGLTAAAVAASRPDLVARLAIVDITPGVDPSAGPAQIRAFFAGPTDWSSREELVERALSFGLGGSPEAAARGVFLNSRVRPDGRVEWKHHFAHLAAAAANAGADPTTPDAVKAVLSATGWDDLGGVTAPVTLVRGERGFVTKTDAEELARRVPGADVRVLSTGHNAQEEDPESLARLIRPLLTTP
ncbi:alpha/beta fold hydrolase [Microbacterium testaceum]|uniref:alpha/beta fold hydrolase n=1 Tax=Microbacterium testaceum TaxID=2033 RepID=UPI0025AF1301|nr:alpha/beta hydrolase [Microbacterium testaceum]WJS91859.1 alpha/beta hydrolase [Microbacterium testaceum]